MQDDRYFAVAKAPQKQKSASYNLSSRDQSAKFVSLQVELEINQPVHSSTSMVAGDFGVTRLLTLPPRL